MLSKLSRISGIIIICLILGACVTIKMPEPKPQQNANTESRESHRPSHYANTTRSSGPEAPYDTDSGIFIGKINIKLNGIKGFHRTESSNVNIHILEIAGDPKYGKHKIHAVRSDSNGIFYLENVSLESSFRLGKVRFKLGDKVATVGKDKFKGKTIGFYKKNRVMSAIFNFKIDKKGHVKSTITLSSKAKEIFAREYPDSPWAQIANKTKNGVSLYTIK